MRSSIDKVKCFNNIMMLDDAGLPGNVSDIKRAGGPTDAISMSIKKSSACSSIIQANNDPAKCRHEKKSMKYVMAKNKQATDPSAFKLELPTAHLEDKRTALVLFAVTVHAVDDKAGALQTMLTLQKSVDEEEEGSMPKADNGPEELISSLGVSGSNQTAKSITGFALIEVNQKLHKVAIRTLSRADYELNDFDQAKSEISMSSFFLPPKSQTKTMTVQTFDITASAEGTVWHTLTLDSDMTKARMMLFMYNIVFPMKKTDMVTKMQEITEDGFKAPFMAWVEIQGKPVPSSGSKGGADSHVSIQVMFPHKEVASEDKITVKFKQKSTFNNAFNPYEGDTVMSASYVILPPDERSMA